MPTYAYKCQDCGDAFDIHQTFTDDALTICPACGGPLRKVFGSVGVTFNGSGFYRNDSRAAAKNSGSTSSKKEPASSKKEQAAPKNDSPATTTSPAKTAPSSS